MKIFRGVYMLLLASVLLSCDAPRLNPFDPQGEDYKFAELDGFVYTSELPKRAIADVVVTWENQNISVKTDSLGYFKITDLSMVNGKLTFEKAGQSKFSTVIEWNNKKSVRVETVNLSSTIGDIDGYLYTTDQTALPIAGVKVFWKNQKQTVTSNSLGYFLFEDLPIVDGWLYFTKDGFKTDSILIEWKDQKNISLEKRTLQYNIGELEGVVLDSYSQPLEKVSVKWSGVSSTVCLTDVDGKYKFSQIPIQNGSLVFEKEGYEKDTLEVQWADVKSKVVPNFKMQSTAGMLYGYVYYQDKQNEGVPNVYVRFEGVNTIAKTDSKGYYSFSNIPIHSGKLYFEKNGFNKDSINVSWTSGNSLQASNCYIKYNSGTITGVVRKDKSSLIYLSGVKVYWKNQNILKETNANGEYTFENVSMNNGYLYFEKTGYSKDSLYIQWGIQNSITARDVRLNAIPVLDNAEVYSVVTNKYPEEFKTKRLNIRAKVSDEENDIDSVYVQCKALNVFLALDYNISTKSFQRELNTANLNVSYIDEVIGKSFDIVVKDITGKKFTLGPAQLKRVISQEVTTYSPKDGEVVGSQPTFTWQKINLEFNYKYYIEIYTDEIPASLVWTSSKFSKDEISFAANTTLTSGDYFWIIWCEDDFGNRASSKPATFTVQ